MVECIRGLDDIAKYRRFRLLRPEQSVHESPRAWWIYAGRCHGLKLVQRHKSHEITKENLRYLELYTKLIVNPNETLTNEQKEFKDRIEKERTYYELKFLREVTKLIVAFSILRRTHTIFLFVFLLLLQICMSRIPDSNQPDALAANQGRSMLVQWFPQWWGWYKTAPAPGESTLAVSADGVVLDTNLPKDQSQLEDEILNALAQGSVENNSLLKRDTVFGKFNFTLKKGSLDICSASKLMLQLLFQNLLLDIESRPRSGSHFVGLSLGSVLLKDYITPNSEFADLIKPQTKEDTTVAVHSRLISQRSRNSANFNSSTSSLSPTPSSAATASAEPIFQLNYERKPLSHNTDYRLLIKTQSLDVVYNIEPIKWIVDFVIKPHQIMNTRKQIEAMKNKTKMELIKNWENILEGDITQRKTWTLEIDISAPQIIFVENFTVRNGTVVVIDFGRLQLTNCTDGNLHRKECNDPDQNDAASLQKDQSEDEEAFMTPCSTPPGSHVSPNDSPTLCSAMSDVMDSSNSNGNGNSNATATETNFDAEANTLNERTLHDKLYDRFKMDLTDLQVLVCKSNERWLFASAKGSSTLHVLDRFSISLQVERRAVYTTDPQYPSVTIVGTLPKLVAHVNEQKIFAITNMLNMLSSTSTQSPHRSPNENFEDIVEPEESDVTTTTNVADTIANDPQPLDCECEASKLFILQFSIDQMSLEVQSRGRCIAELQVSGVKAGFSKRPEDMNITLSVHGLLLVDAIQSFGPDFELLIASHRHVG